MEELVGPEVDVVLSIREGIDFGFLKVPVVAAGQLNTVKMETDVFYVEGSILNFNTDLVWQSNKANVRRMRNNMLPVKLDLLKVFDKGRTEKFGYIIMDLRSAQCLPAKKQVTVSGSYLKVLGLGIEAKGIEERRKTSGVPDTVVEAHAEEVKNDTSERSPSPKQQSLRSPRSKLGLQSTLQVNPSKNIDELGKGDLSSPNTNTKVVHAYHSFKLELRLKSMEWLVLPPKFHFRFHHSRSENVCTAHPDISIDCVNEVVELYDLIAEFRFTETPRDLKELLRVMPPVVSICKASQPRPTVIAKAVVDTLNLTTNGEESIHHVELLDVKSHQLVGKLTYTIFLTDLGPRAIQDVTLQLTPGLELNEGDLPPGLGVNPDLTEKIVDELEDWKERQKHVISQQLSSKLQEEMVQLRSDWMQQKKKLEESVSERMQQCRELGDSLIEATQDLQRKTKEVEEKERSLVAVRADMEERYTRLLTEKTEEAERLRASYEERLMEKMLLVGSLDTEKARLANSLERAQLDNDVLTERVKECEAELERSRNRSLSDEQTAALLQDLKTMQGKLEAANNSKLFFKEQWGRAVREIHRIKSECSKDIQVQLQYRKDELKNLGLEQLFLQEKSQNRLERDDMLEARDFLQQDVESKLADADFYYKGKSEYEVFKTNMDIVKENNAYLTEFGRASEEKLLKLIMERDRRLKEEPGGQYDESVMKLNKEIRHMLER